jgi:hypothetical protein
VALQLVLSATVAGVHVPPVAVAFELLLLAGLASGSGLAWGVFVVINAFPLLAGGAIVLSSGGSGSFGQGVLWGNVAVLFLTGLALEATLLSRSMRRHVGHRRGQLTS